MWHQRSADRKDTPDTSQPYNIGLFFKLGETHKFHSEIVTGYRKGHPTRTLRTSAPEIVVPLAKLLQYSYNTVAQVFNIMVIQYRKLPQYGLYAKQCKSNPADYYPLSPFPIFSKTMGKFISSVIEQHLLFFYKVKHLVYVIIFAEPHFKNKVSISHHHAPRYILSHKQRRVNCNESTVAHSGVNPVNLSSPPLAHGSAIYFSLCQFNSLMNPLFHSFTTILAASKLQ